MKLKQFLIAFMICFSMQNFAKETTTYTLEKNKLNSFVNDTLKVRKNGLNISLGTSGIGFGYARKLNTKFNAIIAYHTLNLNNKEVDISEFVDNNDVDFSGNLKSTIIDLGAEYVPFRNSSFKLVFGLGFLNNVNLNGTITYKEGITYGDVNITPQDVGRVIIDSKWSGTAPFLGFGFGRAIPKNRFGFGIDIGTYFAKSPTVDLDADKLLAPTQDEQSNLQEAFESLTFIPRVQFRITYNF